MKEQMNEQVDNKRNISYVWILSEWVNECPKVADGIDDCMDEQQFIQVVTNTTDQCIWTCICLRPTGHVEYTPQRLLCLQMCP